MKDPHESAAELVSQAFPEAKIVGFSDANQGKGVFSQVIRVTLSPTESTISSVVVKLATDQTNRSAAIRSGAFEREALAYGELLGSSPVESPGCYLIHRHRDGSVSFVLEDLGAKRFVDQSSGLTHDDAQSLTESLHQFHRYWATQPNLDHLPVRRSTVASFDRSELETGLNAINTRWATRLEPWVAPTFSRLLSAGSAVVARFAEAGRATLCHGDPRAGNAAFDDSGRAILFDWQQLGIQLPEADLAWMMATSAKTEDRRSWEPGLLATIGSDTDRYRAALALPGFAVLLLAQREVSSQTESMVVQSLTRIAAALNDYEVAGT